MSADSSARITGIQGYAWNGRWGSSIEKVVYFESRRIVLFQSGEVKTGNSPFVNENRMFDILCLDLLKYFPLDPPIRYYDPNDPKTKKLQVLAKKLAETQRSVEIGQTELEKILKASEKIKQLRETLTKIKLEHDEAKKDYKEVRKKREYLTEKLVLPSDPDKHLWLDFPKDFYDDSTDDSFDDLFEDISEEFPNDSFNTPPIDHNRINTFL